MDSNHRGIHHPLGRYLQVMPSERGLVRPIDGTLLRDLPHDNVTIRDTVLRGFQIRVGTPSVAG